MAIGEYGELSKTIFQTSREIKESIEKIHNFQTSVQNNIRSIVDIKEAHGIGTEAKLFLRREYNENDNVKFLLESLAQLDSQLVQEGTTFASKFVEDNSMLVKILNGLADKLVDLLNNTLQSNIAAREIENELTTLKSRIRSFHSSTVDTLVYEYKTNIYAIKDKYFNTMSEMRWDIRSKDTKLYFERPGVDVIIIEKQHFIAPKMPENMISALGKLKQRGLI